MPYLTQRRAARRGALALASACVALLASAAPSAAVQDAFCPASGGTTTISLAPYAGCTNSVQVRLLAIHFMNGANPFHCAVGKATSHPDGLSSNVTTAVCGYGTFGDGIVTSVAPSGGVLGYARGTNDEGSAWAGYRGRRDY